ncbi:DUF1918 domain-containing protein [Streptomyces chryseus]|uniref:DUF1918 domain-containing protein n=1 Tax=Streptomyces chryseus TaxID=68186 RepID=A0ABQ3DKX3_9ACTN|nr:DUF1918 domain-containing protein [Streptomyces chryseus]GGW90471.1 hypothetical protein GCM10010353_02010 [Streptomyces chryseus]GHA90569.1 hypothetical protein GCM10010346_11480 [Streptomyces chryseus]
MHASEGDQLLVHGRTVGHEDKVAKIVEVLGSEGNPPYRVRFDDGHEALVSPGPDSVVRHTAHGGTAQ